jgi:hypothetical protein
MLKTTAVRGRTTSDQSSARQAAPGSSVVRREATCRFVSALALAGVAFAGVALAPNRAEAQEILLTGPLAGAGAVHELRLYRKGRVEFSPTATFTLLDEYLRQILVGARINYNITDFLAIGVWGGFSPEPLKLPAGLVEKIQTVNEQRASVNAMRRLSGDQPSLQNRLTSLNLGADFEDQVGSIDWIAAPQVTFVPFRGKIALFQSIYIDTDFYIFAGPAIASVTEREECSGPGSTLSGGCSSERQPNDGVVDADGEPIPVPNAETFPTASRIAVAPTFGLGFTFYVNRWNALGFEWRAVPFSRNTGGFDNHGTGPDGDFPDQQVNADDRDLKLNQMLSVSWNFYIPFDYQVSE